MRRFFDELAEGWDERTSAARAAHLAPARRGRCSRFHPGARAGARHRHWTGRRSAAHGPRVSPCPGPRRRLHRGDGQASTGSKVGLDPEGRIAFKVADASDLPYDEDSFDLVAQLNMPPFFAEIARVLRPGGYAIVASSWGPQTPFYTPIRCSGAVSGGVASSSWRRATPAPARSGPAPLLAHLK